MRAISHRVAVLYHGRIVEVGDVRQVIEDPRDPYTQRLLMASPVPDPFRQRERRERYRSRFGISSQAVNETLVDARPLDPEAERDAVIEARVLPSPPADQLENKNRE